MSLEAARQAAQLAFAASGAPLVVGTLEGAPFGLDELKALRRDDRRVVQVIDSGLTAEVWQLEAGGRRWNLKRARAEARVQNVDGQTSFLNEVQRRGDFERLKREPGGGERWAGIVDTSFASCRDGLILSPWIEGAPVAHWGERELASLFGLVCAMWLEGLFEWDLCPGNLLRDGERIRLFDFGYCYRFDPLRHFSSAGHGDDGPLFHPVERFETRCFSAVLLGLEREQGTAAALRAFRQEKAVALDAYRRLREGAAARGAVPKVLAWLDGIVARWQAALDREAGLEALYLAECWRSHRLDVDDDLHGRSCTPTTLARADWLLDAVRRHGATLRSQQALFWDDEGASDAALRQRCLRRRVEAERWQIESASSIERAASAVARPS